MQRCEIQDFLGYWIYEDGRVWSDPKPPANPNGKFLAQPLNHAGYVEYCLHCDGRRYSRKAHRLVLEAFVGPCSEGMECRHLDGNRQNNHVSNLCWGTKKENEADKVSHGTLLFGDRHGKSKLTSIEVMEIRDLATHGPYTQQKIGDMYGVSNHHVSDIKTGKVWNRL